MSTDLAPLIRALEVVRPYLGDIVLVGGWVPIVYQQCTSIYPTRTIRTADIDLACPAPLAVKGESIDDLLRGAGFECNMFGSTEVPFCRYSDNHDCEIEFLTPLKGDGTATVTELQQGLTAENLRYLDVLLRHTAPIKIYEKLVVNVPWISAFLFQKGLSFPDRRSGLKRDKDLYYIFKVVEIVDREYLITELRQVIEAHPYKWGRTFAQNMRKVFDDEYSPGVISVVDQLQHIPGEQSDHSDTLAMRVFVTIEGFMADLKMLA